MENISATNASNSANKDYYHTLAEGIVLCSAFVVEAVLIAVGNLLTVVLFAFNRKLRRKSLFLINMAFSNAMLGAVCLPLYVYLIVRRTCNSAMGKCIWAADEVRYFCPCVAYHFHALIFNFCSVHILWKILCHLLAIETPKTVSARIFHNHFNDMVFGHHCLRCPQRWTLLSSGTFLLRMDSFPTGISICCLCLKH